MKNQMKMPFDSGELDEGKEIITKRDHDSQPEEEFVNSKDSDSNSEENENTFNDDYFIGRDKLCKWRRTSFSKVGKIRSKNVVKVWPGPKPSARVLRWLKFPHFTRLVIQIWWMIL
jgi:hypothetical protein